MIFFKNLHQTTNLNFACKNVSYFWSEKADKLMIMTCNSKMVLHKIVSFRVQPLWSFFYLKNLFHFLDTKGDICINQVPEFMKVYFVLFAASQKYMFYLFVTVFRVSALLMNVFH